MNAMLKGVSEGEKQRLMVALEEMQLKEQVYYTHTHTHTQRERERERAAGSPL